jgi:hypothetical protein
MKSATVLGNYKGIVILRADTNKGGHMLKRKRLVVEEGTFPDLIKDAKTGDLIELGSVESHDVNYKPCNRGMMDYIQNDGFFLNNQRVLDYAGPCRDWFPYQGHGVIVVTDENTLYINEENPGKPMIVHTGSIISYQAHVATETVLVGEKKADNYLLIRSYDKLKRKWAMKWKEWWKVRDWWKKEFVTKHVQPLNVTYPTPVHTGHPDGIVALIHGNFILVAPDQEDRIIHETRQFPPKKWIACKKGIVDVVNGSLCFNEGQTFYEGRSTDVVPTPNGLCHH